jgi:hypothetical protein
MQKIKIRNRPAALAMSEESSKLCDVVYYDVFDFNTTTDVVTAKANARSE